MGTGHTGAVNFDVTAIVQAWLSGQAQQGIAIRKTTTGGSLIKTLATRGTTGAARITVTYQQREPQISAPTGISAPGTIKPNGTSQTITWTASSDSAGAVAQSSIYYTVQASGDGGNTWTALGQTAAGVTTLTANVAAALGIALTDYAYAPGLLMYRVSGWTSYSGAQYQGQWGQSAAGTVDYRYPRLSTPTVNAPGTVTADTATVTWTASADSSGLYAAGALTYDVQVQINGSWINAGTTAAGATSRTVNIRKLAGLNAGQYAYTNIVYRVRASAPSYLGTVRQSAWGTSEEGKIDYRIRPSAPQDVSAAPEQPYEGQTVTVTLGRPTSYNAYSSSGSEQRLTYILRRGGTEIGRDTAAASAATVSITFTAGAWTDGRADTYIALEAYCVDLDGQTGSAWTSSSLVRMRVFREPQVTIDSIGRQQTAATVQVRVPWTGYAGTQQAAQIASIKYSINGGASWTTADTGALAATINITDITADDRYTIMVRAVNAPPTGLTGKTSATVAGIITEFTPAAFIFTDSAGAQGIATKRILVGNDYTKSVPGGSVSATGRFYTDSYTDVYSRNAVINLGSYLFYNEINTALDWSTAAAIYTLRTTNPAGMIIGFNHPDSGGYGVQLFLSYGSDGIIARRMTSGAWSAWKTILTW